jgi:hypothetical protein
MTGGPHEHPEDVVDPRLEVLRALKLNGDDSN